MTASVVLRVEVSVPRAFYAQWKDYHGVEQALRLAGVLPREAREMRWRSDDLGMGYVVSFAVPIILEPQEAVS
jgi:hypothetical protein